MPETIECPYCGWAVEVISTRSDEAIAAGVLYGEESGAWVREARDLRFSADTAALHHACRDQQVADPDWWGPRSWWACKEPGRALDDDVKYDLNCAECGRRHIEGRTN